MADQNQRGDGRGGGQGRDKGRGRGPGGKGRGGDRKGGRGERDGGTSASSAGYRVVGELSTLEKALSKNDFENQQRPLQEIVKSLRPLKLRSVDQFDPATKGRMITTLLRIARQPKPAPAAPAAPAEGAAAETVPEASQNESGAEAAPEASPAEETAAPEAVATEAAATEGEATGEGTAEVAAEATAEGTGEGTADAAAPEVPPAVPEEKKPEAPAKDAKAEAYANVMFLVGSVWRAVGDTDRAEAAFALSGRTPGSHEAEPETQRSDARGEREPRGERRPAPAKGPRGERPPPAGKKAPLLAWQLAAREVEEKGRTREAGKIHEKNNSFVEGARLYGIGKDLRGALRCAAAGKDFDTAHRLMKLLKAGEIKQELEKAKAYELLMEHYVAQSDFGAVAALYEKAKQFDQAGLAWERAGKLGAARKAFERGNDTANASRLRQLEVDKLVERGDRLGAAVLLVSGGEKDKAIEVLGTLPPPKAYRFLQKLKLDDEANKLADRELALARETNRPPDEARWLELVGKNEEAAAVWEKAGRKDRASKLHETLGNLARAAELAEGAELLDRAAELFKKAGDEANAARVAALPRPAVAPKPPEDDAPVEPAASDVGSSNQATER